MAERNDIEMQYKTAAPMDPSQAPPSDASAQETAEPQSMVKKTLLGMRGGGLILDLCACFICCECMEGCCNAVDDCCCC